MSSINNKGKVLAITPATNVSQTRGARVAQDKVKRAVQDFLDGKWDSANEVANRGYVSGRRFGNFLMSKYAVDDTSVLIIAKIRGLNGATLELGEVFISTEHEVRASPLPDGFVAVATA